MTKAEVMRRLRARVKEIGGESAAARAFQVSTVYLWQVLNGKRDPGPKILRALKLRREVRYVESGSA